MSESASDGPDGAVAEGARPCVFYVMGAGRSGSTILGIALGNSEGVFYAGELDAWLARSGEPQVSSPDGERFWADVLDRVPDAGELYGRRTQRTIERSLALLRVHLWPARRRMREPYRRVAQDLYSAIALSAGTAAIVDTSHYPMRARELQALTGIDLCLIFLMRDPRSVVASFDDRDVAQYSKSVITTNVYLWLTNLISVYVFLRHPRARRLFVRYEDFIADPAGVLARILERGGVTAPAPDFTALETGIPFQGNRVIRQRVIALRSEPDRRPRRSPLTSILQLPWALVLGSLQPRTHSEHRGRAR